MNVGSVQLWILFCSLLVFRKLKNSKVLNSDGGFQK